MANISSGIIGDSNLINLSAMNISEIRKEVFDFFINGETVIQAFRTIRDQVIFTSKRIIVVNVQGITGKKVAYMNYPYDKIEIFAVETAGLIDIDCELLLSFIGGGKLQLDFKSKVDIKKICSFISNIVL